MKIYSLFILFLTLISTSVFAQDEFLTGPVTESQIREISIFDVYTVRYQPNESLIKKLNAVQDSIFIDVYMGTWCHDSKREVPALFKIMETLDNPLFSASYTALEYRRRGPKEIIEENNIKRTPTFIIYKNGKEVGRIIEEAKQSIEADLYNVIIGDY
jgi:thiol-disulfide isomerase/thioredoxin